MILEILWRSKLEFMLINGRRVIFWCMIMYKLFIRHLEDLLDGAYYTEHMGRKLNDY